MSDQVADVLDKAVDLLTPEGAWTQGTYARDSAGHSTVSPEQAKCFCVVGAINMVANGNPTFGIFPPRQVLRAVIDSGPASWNDTPGRTQAEVIAALREAATLARKDAN